MNRREFLIISITVFVTVLAWIIADLYHVRNTQKIIGQSPKFERPIRVKINTEIFSLLEKRN